MKRHNAEKGFTLIELLVIIAIIGLLGSIIFASLKTAAGKARDANRKAQMKSLQNALEAYYNDYGKYPDTGMAIYSSEPNNNINAPYGYQDNGDWIPGLVTGGYISSLPHDPLLGKGNNNPNYCAGWMGGGVGNSWIGAYDYISDGKNYKLLSHCAPEFFIGGRIDSPTNPFYDPRRTDHAWMVCSGEPACSNW
ncbi:MAG: hypothetical protein K0S38_799 [Candidatus Paceibacter sp.]|jgi:general secretion pathway protein G|nr:hypothetical protein [Candidatus Paceibacter sp.]